MHMVDLWIMGQPPRVAKRRDVTWRPGQGRGGDPEGRDTMEHHQRPRTASLKETNVFHEISSHLM